MTKIGNLANLFLNFLAISLNFADEQPKTAFDICINTIFEPYQMLSKHLFSLKNDISDSEDDLDKLIQNQEATDSSNDQDRHLMDSTSKEYIPDENKDNIFGIPGTTNKSPCLNGGFLTQTKRWNYMCNGVDLTKEQYIKQNRTQKNCHEFQSIVELCYCSMEYYGPYCQEHNRLICTIARTDVPDKCIGQDSDYYSYSIGGFDPCYKIDPQKDFELKYILTFLNLLLDSASNVNTQSRSLHMRE